MARLGKRKAAMLLATLDEATATELLKGQPQDVIQEVAIELSHLEAAGQLAPEEANATVKEFCTTLQKVNSGSLHIKSFVSTILKSSGGREKAAELHAQMQQAIGSETDFEPNLAHDGGRAQGEPIIGSRQELAKIQATEAYKKDPAVRAKVGRQLKQSMATGKYLA